MRVLIVDDDSDLLALMSLNFSRLGAEVVVALDGDEGLLAALKHRPDVVVSDILMPRMSGWSLVKHVRSHPSLALVPFVFLTELASDQDRLLGYSLGADDYVPKPFVLDELLLRVRRVYQRSQHLVQRVRVPSADEQSPDDFSGSLAAMGVPTVLGVLDMERSSGVLHVKSSRGKAEIKIRFGSPCAATIAGTKLRNEQAIYETVRWREGRFHFKISTKPPEGNIQLSTTQLLLEGARLADEADNSRK